MYNKIHPYSADASFDGGTLDCGNGLLLLIRKHIDPLQKGQLLEIHSRELSVEEDLPAWCRLTKNELVSIVKNESELSFLVSKGPFEADKTIFQSAVINEIENYQKKETVDKSGSEEKYTPQEIHPFSVMGIGSWPRPSWLIPLLHQHISGQLSLEDFNSAANDAVRLCVQDQEQASVDVFTDGEMRRDNYSSFVAGKLENCQLIPLVDLLPLVDDPEKFQKELDQLDVPAAEVRHPAVFGKIKRHHPLALLEARFLRTITKKPIKIALPGPYLLTRTMWMDCISDMAYGSREELACDIVKVLREELISLIDFGVEIVQFDEPVLTEVVFAAAKSGRTFMCGALGEKLPPEEELHFASGLLNKVCAGISPERLGLHVCRGNWTRDETKALSGDYLSLIRYFNEVHVGTLFLEHATSRAGTLEFISSLPERFDLALGFVNQKKDNIENKDNIIREAEEVLKLMDGNSKRKLHLVPDCGFATFADSPIAASKTAIAKLKVLHEVSLSLKLAKTS
ncbi:MAG TPA: 5-methyltetrahydropteroyltriglutamate--homocysteine methyltransferase [Oligoflexia bacterium]|nr:5-methyltetrahydropteroyltriglutamate--homocysteine methyltransferase [Oligoflexia bacterium]HMP47413.1 5-methyltetrahydropteroyltriglutamate--homocysteine methyltransferase [Oligoflexia bacterium]